MGENIQEDVATTAAVLSVRNSWVAPSQTPNEWEQQPHCIAGRRVSQEGLKIYNTDLATGKTTMVVCSHTGMAHTMPTQT
jgi:hypothetical protein